MKRKKLFASIATFCLSIALMMFGVYAAASPNVKLSGQVNYSVYDAKILALGRVENAKTLDGSADVNAATYPTVNADYKTSTKVNTLSQYLDYTTGADKNDSNDNFSTWEFGDLSFNESNVNPIKFYLNFTNFSLYDVVATITFESSEEDLASNNLTRNVSETEVIIAGYNQTATSKEIIVEYDVINRGAKVNKFNVNANIEIKQYLANAPAVPETPAETLEGWIYEEGVDAAYGKLIITGYEGSETEIVIPAYLDGKPVVELSSPGGGIGLFGWQDTLIPVTSVTIPSTIERINGSFGYCTTLKTVNLSEGLKEIGEYTFMNCSSLENIVIPNSVNLINNTAFYDCDLLKSVTIYAENLSISDSAFMSCDNLTEVIVMGENPFDISKQEEGRSYNPFEYLPENFVIYVPDEYYENYTADTSWNVYTIKKLSEKPAA